MNKISSTTLVTALAASLMTNYALWEYILPGPLDEDDYTAKELAHIMHRFNAAGKYRLRQIVTDTQGARPNRIRTRA